MVQGSNNHLFGSYQATNTPVTFNNVNVQGSITTGGAIDVQGGSVGGDVRSNNHGITLENTSVQGAVFANGNIIIDNSSVSGSIETPNNSLTVTDSTITGSLTANGNIMVTRANVSGNITTPHNAITVLDSDIVGSLTANGDIKVTNSELKGDVTTSNNGIVITETNVVGDLSANGNIITDNSFVTGDITSTNNQVTLNNKSYILGNVTAGRPDWGTVNVNGGSTVTGVCQYRTVPDNACGITPALKCFNDNFNQSDLTQNWVTFKSSGDFTPSIVNSRLRLTQAVQNQATASTFQRIFPAANNRVEVEFDYFAYGGTGADGVAIVFSDATVTPQVGAFGGPLGYGYKVAEQQPGFAGGWLGIGLDEYGNYSVEGGGNSVNSRRRQAVVLRGSGAGYSGYNYLAGTCNNGSTNINSDCLSPKVDNTNGNPQHRYRIVIDSTQPSTSFVTVSRKVGTSSWVDLIGPINVMSLSGQENVPNELFMSITGSTGSVTNNHEIDNFEVCALNSRPVGQQIDHFRMDLPAQGLTCKASEVTVTACANSNCSEIFTDPVTAFLTPSSAPSASGGWLNGPSLALTNGVGVSQLRKNSVSSTNRVNVGISGSNPTAIAFNSTLCRRGGGVYSSTACYVDFVDSGFEIQVPHAYANQLVTGTITALSKGDNPEQCIPSFAGVDKDVSLWSEYLIPSGGQGFSAMNVVVDGSAISNNIAAPSHRSLYFDQNGQAEFELTYREAGSLALHARFTGSGDEQDLQLTGQANFIRVPRALLLSANHSYDLAHSDGKCSAADLSCSVFARAGEGFNLNIKAVAAEPNEDNDFTNNLGLTNYQQQNIILNHTLVEPSNGSAGSIGTLNYHHELGSSTTVQQSVHEVGVFDFSLVPPTSYLGLDLIAADLPIAVTSTGPIGRFIPAYFDVSPMTVTLAAACSTGGQPFTYLGQPFGYANNPGLYLQPKSGSGSDTLNYLIGDWWRYDNDWENREYINNINSLTVEKVSLNANVIRQPSLGSGVILNDEQLRYQKPIDPMVPFNADFNLQLSINDLRDSDDVCYRTSYSEDCLGYTFENIDQTMPLYWGRLTIEDVFGPETQGLEQPIYVERYTSNGFVRTTEDNCTALPAITGFILQSDDYVVVTEGSAVPPQVLAEHTAGNFAQGKRIVRFSAPGAGVRGVIDTMLNLDTHNLMWLAEPDDEKTLEDQPWQYYFKDSTQGQVQFGLYRGNDRVIWWRETN